MKRVKKTIIRAETDNNRYWYVTKNGEIYIPQPYRMSKKEAQIYATGLRNWR